MRIEISLAEYKRLKRDGLKLEYLECGGVDNWGYYGDALNPIAEGQKSFDETWEGMEKAIDKKYSVE